MENLTVVDHPLLERDVTILRRDSTPHGQFRKTVSDAASILAYEAMRELDLEEVLIETPLESTTGHEIAEEVMVVPIMRAGLGMVDGFVRYVPEARVGHLGMQRDEDTYRPVDYYSNIPDGIETAHVFVVDPMLATGGSATFAIDHLKDRGGERLHVCMPRRGARRGAETPKGASGYKHHHRRSRSGARRQCLHSARSGRRGRSHLRHSLIHESWDTRRESLGGTVADGADVAV